VQAHHVGVEVGQHGDAADDCLAGDSQTKRDRESKEFRALFAHPDDHEEHAERDDDEDKGEESITEFDDSVKSHFCSADKGVLRAARPGWTSETRLRQANGSTRPDNENLADQGGPGEEFHPANDPVG